MLNKTTLAIGLSVFLMASAMAPAPAGAWIEQKLPASDGISGDSFGGAVSISGNEAFVGAGNDDDKGNASGSVYLFERIGGTWTETAKFSDPDGSHSDWFGYSVSVSGDPLIVGAMSDDAAYVYAPGQAQPFALVGPENGAPHGVPPVFEWTPGEYDVFRVYLVLPLFGTYYTIPTHWMVDTTFALSSYDPLWDYVDATWALWVVLGANTATESWDVTDPWAFLKVAP